MLVVFHAFSVFRSLELKTGLQIINFNFQPPPPPPPPFVGCGERVRVDRSSAAKNFKMRVTGSKFGRVFSLGLLLLVLTARVSRQQGTRQVFSAHLGSAWH